MAHFVTIPLVARTRTIYRYSREFLCHIELILSSITLDTRSYPGSGRLSGRISTIIDVDLNRATKEEHKIKIIIMEFV